MPVPSETGKCSPVTSVFVGNELPYIIRGQEMLQLVFWGKIWFLNADLIFYEILLWAHKMFLTMKLCQKQPP